MKNVLVTGAAGFIGARTAEMFLDQGVNVVGLDNLNDYYDIRLKEYRLNKLKEQTGFTFYRVSIEDPKALGKIFSRHNFDAVVNLAARAGVRYSLENPHVYMSTNAVGTLNLLDCMRKHDIKKMVLASTSSIYAGQPLPFNEDLPVNRPISPYAASKKAAELMAHSYHHLYGLDITVLRYFTVYGPAGRPDMSIFRFIKWIDEGEHPVILHGDGSQSRDFTYIDDIARGTVAATADAGFEIINLGGGAKPVSISKLIQMLEELLGKKANVVKKPFHKADLRETSADITKAGRLLNWKPEVNLEEGLRKTVSWYQKNRSWLKDISLLAPVNSRMTKPSNT